MKEVKIISLSGYIESGKNYIADLAEKQFGYKQFMLAAIPKEIVCRTHGITLKELEDRKNKEKYRKEIIDYAEKLKEVNLHIFCNDVHQLILKDLASPNPAYKYLVVDVRFPFEALYFRKLARCTKTQCEITHIEIPGYQVTYKSLYIESDLANKSSKADSESHYNYLKKTRDGVILNGTEQRYDRKDTDLINQLVKFV
jgi:hypothetical protein